MCLRIKKMGGSDADGGGGSAHVEGTARRRRRRPLPLAPRRRPGRRAPTTRQSHPESARAPNSENRDSRPVLSTRLLHLPSPFQPPFLTLSRFIYSLHRYLLSLSNFLSLSTFSFIGVIEW